MKAETQIWGQAAVLSVSVALFPMALSAQDHDHGAMPAPVASDNHSQHAASGHSHEEHALHMQTDAGEHSDAHVHAEHHESASVVDSGAHAQHLQAVSAADSHAQHQPSANAADSHAQHGGAAMNMSTPDAASSGMRDPHAYSNGLRLGSGPYSVAERRLHMADEMKFSSFQMNRLEQLRLDGQDGIDYDLQASFGNSYNGLVMKAEGELRDGSLEESETELLWSRAIGGFWNAQFGVRNETGGGPDRNWLAAGMQGVAPYWFWFDATAYIGEGGRTAFNVEGEYELLLSQRLILEPRIEVNFFGKDDSARGIGSGLSNSSAGLRLKYQVTRQFIPYFGVEQVKRYGRTADFAGSEDASDTRWLAGVRFWF